MRRVQPLAAANPLLLALFLSTTQLHSVHAYPYPLQNTNNEDYGGGLRFLLPRQCVQRCGSDGQYCCDSNTECFTSANIAGCSARDGDAWGIYTTTWTETNTYTSTVTTHFAQPTDGGHEDSGVDCEPNEAEGETACGSICCADFQFCAERGSCKPREGWGGGGGGGDVTRTITSDGQVVTTRFSAPFRPTGTSFSRDGSATAETTPPASGTAIGSDGDNGDEDTGGGTGGGLSGGEIAGIVIGVLAGLWILGMICFCCIARGLWGLCCGSRKKDERRERVEVQEEYYRGGSRAPSAAAHAQRDRHTGWFGRPRSAGSRRDEKDKGSGAKWLGLGAAAATLLALLHFRRGDKKEERQPRSRYTDSYYSYSDFSESARDTRSRGSDLTSYLGNSSQGGSRYPPRRSDRGSQSQYSRR